MLQSQVNYWTLEETKRHNLATEEAGYQQARAAEVSASASRMQAETSRMLVPFEQMKAEASQAQASASLMQAEAALQNAETNRGNLDVNRMNADTNRYNADINKQNADTNRLNAAINQQNADTNAFNAQINAYNAETQRYGTMSQIDLNQAKTREADSNTYLNYLKGPGVAAESVTKQVESHYAEAEHVVGLVDTGSHVISNIGSGVGSLFRGAGSLISAGTGVVSEIHDEKMDKSNSNVVGKAISGITDWVSKPHFSLVPKGTTEKILTSIFTANL